MPVGKLEGGQGLDRPLPFFVRVNARYPPPEGEGRVGGLCRFLPEAASLPPSQPPPAGGRSKWLLEGKALNLMAVPLRVVRELG